MSTDVLLSRDTVVGQITIEPVDVDRDGDLLHTWITHPRSTFWGMQDATVQDVWNAYAAIVADQHHDAWLGRVDGAPAFLAETYDPEHSELAGTYDWRLGDIGMHLLVAPTDRPLSGSAPSWSCAWTILDGTGSSSSPTSATTRSRHSTRPRASASSDRSSSKTRSHR
jgi:hypothetical protein